VLEALGAGVVKTTFARFARHMGGVTSIEYALIAGFIALGIIVSITGIAPALNLTFNNVKTNVSR
jgi:Flp pilus assembly pilin Flp